MTTAALRPLHDLELLAPEAPLSEALRWAVAHAVLAPSELNAQPWRFRARVDDVGQLARLELALDRNRLLRHLDPDGQEAVLACGAALLNLRLALRAAALGTSIRFAPDSASPDLLAAVTVSGRAHERPQDRPLREAIPFRGCRRAPFVSSQVPATLVDHLVAEAGYEGALLTLLDPDGVGTAEALDETATALDALDAGRADDRARWSRVVPGSEDGVPGAAHDLGLLASLTEARRLRHGSSQVAPSESRRDRADATVLVIGSAGADRPSLMRAGAGTQRVLLAATAAGFSARFVNGAVRYPDLRHQLGELAGLDHPQAVLHLGLGDPDGLTGRRPVDDVLDLRRTPLEER